MPAVTSWSAKLSLSALQSLCELARRGLIQFAYGGVDV